MKKNLPLIVGLTLPILLVIIMALVIFIPSININPQHNFIYSNEHPFYVNLYQNTYKVEDDKILPEPLPRQPGVDKTKPYPVLYIYDVKDDTSHQISLEEAQKYAIDPGPSSPDGYTVDYQYSHDGIFEIFGSNNNSSGYFIVKDSGKKKLSGINRDSYSYSGDFKFIGWIK